MGPEPVRENNDASLVEIHTRGKLKHGLAVGDEHKYHEGKMIHSRQRAAIQGTLEHPRRVKFEV